MAVKYLMLMLEVHLEVAAVEEHLQQGFQLHHLVLHQQELEEQEQIMHLYMTQE